ncbi:3-phytase B [Wickerhamiella sorbophila]|uniref:3-phytase B n=1 Tax=Wickerhamiella sorbophila TaxID=45607 RepID=A0A2T0FHT6_9ASCO|nr:3-phytase B [Wickerhamiella sorbophila]PRT54563.1 3-phytase B [Wickerhamiella sorbophila]
MIQELLCAAIIMAGADAAFGRTFAGTAAYPQTFVDEFNPLKYTGNLGPYSQRPGVGISPDVPAGCKVEQVVLFARHGERYPTPNEVTAQEKLLSKLNKWAPKKGFVGSLTFLNKYKYFLPNEGYANLEIPSGPYSGLAGSFQFGAEFAGKYGDLWNDEVLPLFSDDFERDLETARAFGQGFLGFNYSTSAAINTYPSFETCDAKKWTTCDIKSNSSGFPANNLRYPAFEVAALRLNEENHLKLTVDDVYTLLALGSYEISATGSSPWVDVFTTEEWLAFQYSYDAYFDCYFGSQSPRAKAVGSLFVNATAELLKKGPKDSLALALVFGHDVDLTAILAAMDLATPSRKIDPKTISFNNNFRLTDVAPMGARFVIERLSCKAPGLTNDTNLVGMTNSTTPLWNSNWTSPDSNFTDWYPNITMTNSTSASNGSMWNGTMWNSTMSNGTMSNSTWSNGTSGTNSSSSSNSTSSGGASWSANVTETTFIRFVLNDAVVPWDHGYDGPGFSVSLEKFLEVVDKQVEAADYETVCGTKPEPLTFFTKYNTTTGMDYDTHPIPFQAGQY